MDAHAAVAGGEAAETDADDALAVNTLDHFAEAAELREILARIEAQRECSDATHAHVKAIFEKYQEQPHLMDAHIDHIVNSLLRTARWASGDPSRATLMHSLFRLIYVLSKVRGHKTIVRTFPHEVVDLKPVLDLLQSQNVADQETWETRYVLLLWLSMACLIPFDMAVVDYSASARESGATSIVDAIMTTARRYLAVTDKARDAAGLVVARFITRPDMRALHMGRFFEWARAAVTGQGTHVLEDDIRTVAEDPLRRVFVQTGALSAMVSVFALGRREDLLAHVDVAMGAVSSLWDSKEAASSTTLRKLATKLVQRAGMTYLRPRVASWRYQRGSRSLMDNLRAASGSTAPTQSAGTTIQDVGDEDDDVPEQIEEVLGRLLVSIADRDTVVRWSAAKGVGRITGRLPKELADDVVGNVLEQFRGYESDGAWHGACLALAELARRGLLLPARLDEAVAVVMKALRYDVRRGSYSVGSHVRDAACYVCWAFARAYAPEVMRPHVTALAPALVSLACYDREVNCRRAASAAFQESVGRQGNFPHGIDIVTTADYFAIGTRAHAFLDVAPKIAVYPEYTAAMVDVLLSAKVNHWDRPVRELAASALGHLVAVAPAEAPACIDKLVAMSMSIDVNARHGSILAIGEVALALSRKVEEGRAQPLSQKHVDAIAEIFPSIIRANLYRGVGGELMRAAVCGAIRTLSLAHFPVHASPAIVECWQFSLDEALTHTETELQEAAASALGPFMSEYYASLGDAGVERARVSVLDRYLTFLAGDTAIVHMRRGLLRGLGAFPATLLKTRFASVMRALTAAVELDADVSRRDAESRKNAVRSLCDVCVTSGARFGGNEADMLCGANSPAVFGALLLAMRDYASDNRGDVGSWVREAAMAALGTLLDLCRAADARDGLSVGTGLVRAETVSSVSRALVQQALEKIDRTRACAGGVLERLVAEDYPFVPRRDLLLERIRSASPVNWSAPSVTFPLLVPLLDCDEYREPCVEGLAVSVGGLTESLVRHANASLLDYLRARALAGTPPSSPLVLFARELLAAYARHEKDDRVSLPLLKTTDALLSSGVMSALGADGSSWPIDLLNAVKKEISNSGDAHKLIASINVFCGLLQFPGQPRSRALQQLAISLCHKFPKIRRTTADQMYVSLLTYDDVCPEENADQIQSLLSETQWDLPVEELRPVRNELCGLFGIPAPTLKAGAAAKTASAPAAGKAKPKDDFASYRDLVDRMGHY